MASGSADASRMVASLVSASHQDILSSVAFGFSTERQDLSIAYSDGEYFFQAEHQRYLLPMTTLEAKELILQFVPRIDRSGLQLLLTILTHRAWKP